MNLKVLTYGLLAFSLSAKLSSTEYLERAPEKENALSLLSCYLDRESSQDGKHLKTLPFPKYAQNEKNACYALKVHLEEKRGFFKLKLLSTKNLDQQWAVSIPCTYPSSKKLVAEVTPSIQNVEKNEQFFTTFFPSEQKVFSLSKNLFALHIPEENLADLVNQNVSSLLRKQPIFDQYIEGKNFPNKKAPGLGLCRVVAHFLIPKSSSHAKRSSLDSLYQSQITNKKDPSPLFVENKKKLIFSPVQEKTRLPLVRTIHTSHPLIIYGNQGMNIAFSMEKEPIYSFVFLSQKVKKNSVPKKASHAPFLVALSQNTHFFIDCPKNDLALTTFFAAPNLEPSSPIKKREYSLVEGRNILATQHTNLAKSSAVLPELLLEKEKEQKLYLAKISRNFLKQSSAPSLYLEASCLVFHEEKGPISSKKNTSSKTISKFSSKRSSALAKKATPPKKLQAEKEIFSSSHLVPSSILQHIDTHKITGVSSLKNSLQKTPSLCSFKFHEEENSYQNSAISTALFSVKMPLKKRVLLQENTPTYFVLHTPMFPSVKTKTFSPQKDSEIAFLPAKEKKAWSSPLGKENLTPLATSEKLENSTSYLKKQSLRESTELLQEPLKEDKELKQAFDLEKIATNSPKALSSKNAVQKYSLPSSPATDSLAFQKDPTKYSKNHQAQVSLEKTTKLAKQSLTKEELATAKNVDASSKEELTGSTNDYHHEISQEKEEPLSLEKVATNIPKDSYSQEEKYASSLASTIQDKAETPPEKNDLLNQREKVQGITPLAASPTSSPSITSEDLPECPQIEEASSEVSISSLHLEEDEYLELESLVKKQKKEAPSLVTNSFEIVAKTRKFTEIEQEKTLRKTHVPKEEFSDSSIAKSLPPSDPYLPSDDLFQNAYTILGEKVNGLKGEIAFLLYEEEKDVTSGFFALKKHSFSHKKYVNNSSLEGSFLSFHFVPEETTKTSVSSKNISPKIAATRSLQDISSYHLQTPILHDTETSSFYDYSLQTTIWDEKKAKQNFLEDSLANANLPIPNKPSFSVSLSPWTYELSEEFFIAAPKATEKTALSPNAERAIISGLYASSEITEQTTIEPNSSLEPSSNPAMTVAYTPSFGVETIERNFQVEKQQRKEVTKYNRQSEKQLKTFRESGAYNSFSEDNAFTTEVAVSPRKTGGYHFTISLIPNQESTLKPVKQNYIFVIDRSSSIKKHRYLVFKKAVARALAYLNEGDSFNIYFADHTVEKMSETPLVFSRSSLRKARDFLKNSEYSTRFSSLDTFELLTDIKKSIGNYHPHHSVILLSDGGSLNKLQNNKYAFQDFLNSPGENFTLFTASASQKNNLPMLDLISMISKGELMHSATHASFPRKLAALISHVRSLLVKDIHINVASLDKTLNIEIYPHAAFLPNFYQDKPYQICGTIDRLEGFDLLIQGKFNNKYLHIRKEIDFKDAKPVDRSFKRRLAMQQAYVCYEYYMKEQDSFYLKEATRILAPYRIPTAVR